MSSLSDLIPEEDFYWSEEGFMVFTAHYLLKRGYCCHQACRHCPYSKPTELKSASESEANYSRPPSER